ncbi:hypothetical protein KR084_004026 [Drosophila pseudotakahashii]|nr:hypothetical protein KR084_004026 [Drosophila pseudotakahashii]
MARLQILVLSLILFCRNSHAVISELARQGESAIQGLADFKMAPLRYLDVLFGANPGGLRGLDGGIYGTGGALSAAAAALQGAKAANILAGGDIFSPGYSKVTAGVGQGSDLITIIKNARPYDPYLIPPGISGYNYPLGLSRRFLSRPPGGPVPGPGPNPPSGSFTDGISLSKPFPGGLLSLLRGGLLPGVLLPGGSYSGEVGSSGQQGGSVGVGGSVSGGGGNLGNGGIFGNGGLFGTGIFGQNGLFGTGFLSGRSLDPFGIFTPFGNLFGGLGNLFGFSSSTRQEPPRGLEGSISVDLGGTLPSPKGMLGGLLSPLLGVFG